MKGRYEELKMRVKLKLVVASRKLADIENLLQAFWSKHEMDGKPVFANKLDFELEKSKLDPKNIMGGFDEEIAIIKKELEQSN